MKKGDLCFRYHSNEGKEIVGIAQVSQEAYQDPTTDNINRVVVELIPHKKLDTPITLDQIKNDPQLQNISILKQQRLSVAPITAEEFEYINQLS